MPSTPEQPRFTCGAVAPSSTPSSPFSLGLSHVSVAIPRGSEARARRFYVDVLGLAEVDASAIAAPGELWLQADALLLRLVVASEFVPTIELTPGIIVGRLDELALRLAGFGLTLIWGGTRGQRRLRVRDPFDNRLEFLEAQPVAAEPVEMWP